MGTTYNITVVDVDGRFSTAKIQADVDSVLAVINGELSTYDPTSSISRFNAFYDTANVSISTHFSEVVAQSMEISNLTGGAFDITVMPLIRLWGFRTATIRHDWVPPDRYEIDSLLTQIGYNNLKISKHYLAKSNPDLHIDVNAIAKGYGVDEVARLLKQTGFTDFLVEIGGEMVTAGLNEEKKSWRIGIETPSLESSIYPTLYSSISISGGGIATSGDYRNYVEYEGRIFSHILDPRTGYPTDSSVGSATVIAPTCMLADGLATSLLILGIDEGMDLIHSMDGVEAFLIVRRNDGTFEEIMSDGFEGYLKN